MPIPSRSFRIALVLVVAVTAGCSKGPAMVHVSGKVLNKDGSVPKGGVRSIRFEPTQDTSAESRRVASGAIGDDGSYELFTKKPGDGILRGKYNVTFTVWKGPHDSVSLIPEKYTASATTPYKEVMIDHDQTDLISARNIPRPRKIAMTLAAMLFPASMQLCRRHGSRGAVHAERPARSDLVERRGFQLRRGDSLRRES